MTMEARRLTLVNNKPKTNSVSIPGHKHKKIFGKPVGEPPSGGESQKALSLSAERRKRAVDPVALRSYA